MNPRKTDGEKSIPAGISLPRELIEQAKAYAKTNGLGGLSGFVRHLLTTSLADTAERVSQQAEAKSDKKIKSGLSKIKSRKQQGY